MNPKKFLSETDKNRIEEAIKEAEKLTSGEIRLHIQSKTKENVLDAAVAIFHQLDMHKTALHNGVLLYLSINDNQFAIIGDSGIHAVVPTNFWDTIYKGIIPHFQQKQFADGLVWAISQAGIQLATYFPIQSDDTNELSNEISFEIKK
ncbi:MAG: TPM domain-containing protein [Paludibacteraceae bacterium]|nr:TPM domain-containing protein [Paludibacteraceae bacterium]MBP6284590.1 TPM domain-containing protein [Paludibacteraceae bacterium]